MPHHGDWKSQYYEVGYDVDSTRGDDQMTVVDAVSRHCWVPLRADRHALEDTAEERGQSPCEYECSGAYRSNLKPAYRENAIVEEEDREFDSHNRGAIQAFIRYVILAIDRASSTLPFELLLDRVLTKANALASVTSIICLPAPYAVLILNPMMKPVYIAWEYVSFRTAAKLNSA